MDNQIVLHIVFLLIGLLALIMFVFSFARSIKLKLNGIITEGIITDFKAGNPGRYGGTEMPVITFKDLNEGSITFSPQLATSNKKLFSRAVLGSKVEVLYDNKNSQIAQINSFFYLWFKPIFILFFGAVFFAFGVSMFF